MGTPPLGRSAVVALVLSVLASGATAQVHGRAKALDNLPLKALCDSTIPPVSYVDLEFALRVPEICAVTSSAWEVLQRSTLDSVVARLTGHQPPSSVALSEFSMQGDEDAPSRWSWLVQFSLDGGGAIAVAVSQDSGRPSSPYFVHSGTTKQSESR
jgi:hypothetical protein